MVEEPKISPLRPGVKSEEVIKGEIPIYVTKSSLYRVVHADGVFGGGTPTPGNIMMTVFNHRVPFPEKIVNDGRGNEITSKRQVKYGLEQEFEVSIVMGLETAKIMRQWLDNTIKNTEFALSQEHQRNQQK